MLHRSLSPVYTHAMSKMCYNNPFPRRRFTLAYNIVFPAVFFLAARVACTMRNSHPLLAPTIPRAFQTSAMPVTQSLPSEMS